MIGNSAGDQGTEWESEAGARDQEQRAWTEWGINQKHGIYSLCFKCWTYSSEQNRLKRNPAFVPCTFGGKCDNK